MEGTAKQNFYACDLPLFAFTELGFFTQTDFPC